MTISLSNNVARQSYAIAQGATQSSFTVSFAFFDDDDLNVFVDGTLKTLTTHYTVSGGSGSTGSITMTSGNAVTGITGGSTVVITRDIDLDRTTDFPSSGPFAVSTLNTELDKITAQFADRKDVEDRAIRLQDQDEAQSMELPLKASRLGKVLAFNASTGAVEAGPTIADTQALAAITADISTLADIEDGTDATNAIQTVAGISSNVTSVAGNSANISTVGGIASNITTVAGIASNVTTVAGKASFITADFVADLNTLATADIVSDLNTLATSAIVTDMDALANITTELDALGDITSNVTTVAGISSNVTTVAGVAANVTTVAGVSSNVSTVAGIASNVTTVATNNANVTTVASNISGVNSFAERYRVGSSDPTSSLDEGDLAYNTSDNALKYYNGSAWASITPGITDIVQDTSPQLGGNLDLNSNNITGTGNIPAANLTGALPALDGSALTGVEAFPSGTSMLFQQTAAPTGWTKQTTHNDKAIRIVTGSVSTGGSVAFSTAMATPSVSGSVSISGAPSAGNLAGNTTINGSVSSTTLSINQIPSHSHTYVFKGGSGEFFGNQGGQNGSKNTGNKGGSGSHNHGHNFAGNATINGAPGVGNLAGSLSSSTATINVSYVDFIIANKN